MIIFAQIGLLGLRNSIRITTGTDVTDTRQ